MDKQHVLCLLKWYIIQTLKRNKVLAHAITWMNFEGAVLSEKSQALTATYCMIPE